MKKLYLYYLRILITVSIFLPGADTNAGFPPGFQATQIATGLNPTDMKFSPDGQYLFVTDKAGRIFMVENDVWINTPVLDITPVIDSYNERGLTHLCADPGFATNGYLYVYYSRKAGNNNRIARFTFNFTTKTFDPASEYVLLEVDEMLAAGHLGGAMVFGQDGKLYVTNGDNNQSTFAQSFSSLHGKVLRMNSDGSIPADNPFYNVLTGRFRYIYALGFRNPYTMACHPVTGQIFVCDVGQHAYEEINELTAGKNYGWGIVEGPKPDGVIPPADYQDPIYWYSTSTGCAIIGGDFYLPASNPFPPEYHGKFFFSDYCNQTVSIFNPATYQYEGLFATGIGYPVAFAIRPNGDFYYIDRGGVPSYGDPNISTYTNNGVLWKVTYTGDLSPSIAAHPRPATASVGNGTLFSVIANGQELEYQWLRNGDTIPGATESVLELDNLQLSDSGAVFSCYVSNSHGSVVSNGAILRVTNRPPPVPVILTPADTGTYVANTMLYYSGMATDSLEGTLPADRLTWKVDFHHDAHTHPVLEIVTGLTEDSFFISPNIEVSGNVWYRIYLTAVNDIGIYSTVYRDIHPQKVTLSLKSNVPGIPLTVEGGITPLPAGIQSVKGVMRSIQAPATYIVGDTLFSFTGWGNGNTNPHLSFATPHADTTITANYEKTTTWTGTGLTGLYYNNTNFSGAPVYTRTDTAVNFDWEHGSPLPGIINENNFTIRWRGLIQPRTSGLYTFYVNSNDGVRLYVNGQLLIDAWGSQITTERTATIALTAGERYPIQLDYLEEWSEAVCQLRWSGPEVLKQLIARSSLYTVEAALPVRFEQFTVTPENKSLQLNWTIEDLGNVKDYTIERRLAGSVAFKAIAYIPASGSKTYSYTDISIEQNKLHEYRILQTDHDGRSVYSPVRTGLLSSRAGFDVSIIPNPVTSGRQVQLVFTQAVGNAVVHLLSADGRIVLSKQLQPSQGQSATLSLQGVAAGTYYIKVVDNDKVLTKKIMLQ